MRPADRPAAPFALVFAVLAVSVMSFTLLQSMTVPALPLLQAELGSDQGTAAWVVTAQLLAAAVATPIVGRLGDAFGKNRVLVAALLSLAVGAALAAVATSMTVLIGARVVQGIGGGIVPLAFGIARDEFPEHRRNSAISVISSLLAVGFGAGILVAGPLVEVLNYHWLFILPAIVAGLAALAASLVIPPSPSRSIGGVSFLPAVLMAGWLTALLLAVSQAPDWGWTSAPVLGLVVAAAVVCWGWVAAERVARAPVVDLTMMRRRPVWTTNLVALLVGFSMYATFAFVPQLVQTPTESGYGLGASVSQAGLIMLPAASCSFLMGLLASPLARRFGAKPLVVAACLVGCVGTGGVALFHDRAWQVGLFVGVNSLGIGLAFALLATLIVAAVPAHQTGVATGMNANLRTVGGAIGTAVATSIVTAQALPGGFPAEAGYRITFLVQASMLVVAAGAALLVSGRREAARHATAVAVATEAA